MVIYKHFRATTFFKAFLLNAILISISAVCAYFIHDLITKYHNKINLYIIILLTFLGTFITAMVVQIFMFYVFAFGGGMLTRKSPRKHYHLFK